MPNITSVALSANCLSGYLPHEMCESSRIEVLSMDGLGVADGCPGKATSLFTPSVTLFNTMEGTLPTCLWSLPRLRTLHLAGNGFSGKIPEHISPSLLDIILSHNYLSGSIPKHLQERHSIDVLDLSFNRISGEYSHGNVTDADTIVSLEINRISGSLKGSSLSATNHLNILDGKVLCLLRCYTFC